MKVLLERRVEASERQRQFNASTGEAIKLLHLDVIKFLHVAYTFTQRKSNNTIKSTTLCPEPSLQMLF